MRNRHRADENDLAVFRFGVTTQDFRHLLLPMDLRQIGAFLGDEQNQLAQGGLMSTFVMQMEVLRRLRHVLIFKNQLEDHLFCHINNLPRIPEIVAHQIRPFVNIAPLEFLMLQIEL
jgi:hypothetical protein